jgi:hypothetical protein
MVNFATVTSFMNGAAIVPIIPFKEKTGNPDIYSAMAIVNSYVRSSEFKADLRNYPHRYFDMADIGPNEFIMILVETFEKYNLPAIHVRTKFMWLKRVYACVYAGEPNTMYLNSRTLKRSSDKKNNVASLAGTIGHELIHILDSYSPKIFWHGDNNPVGKEMTLPYWFGRCVQQYALEALR